MAKTKHSVTHLIIEMWKDGAFDEPLTSHFTTLRIINSTRSIWPIFQIYFYADNQDFIERNIYGQMNLSCKIWYTDYDGNKIEPPITYEFVYIEAKMDLPAKEEKNMPWDNRQESQRRHIVLYCLAKPAYLAMTAFVNKLWEDPDGLSGTAMKPLDFVKEILDQNGIDRSKMIDDGQNMDTVQQLLIPPMTIKAAVDYINQNYGLYTGPVFRYANYAGQFLMWDLRKMYDRHKNAPWLKLHKSPSHFTTPGMFDKINRIAIGAVDEFVTYDAAESIHHANANTIRFGYDNIYIYHPHEDIAVFQKRNLDDIITNYGIWHSKDEMKYHQTLKNRKMYFNDMVGHEIGTGYDGEYNDNILTQDMATSFQNAAAVRLVLYRNVKIHMVQKVGEVLYLKPYSDFEKAPGNNYEGGYLISDSEIVLSYEQRGKPEENLNCIATLTAYRTDQSMD